MWNTVGLSESSCIDVLVVYFWFGFFCSLEVTLTHNSSKNDSVQLCQECIVIMKHYLEHIPLLHGLLYIIVLFMCFSLRFFLKKDIYFKGMREVQSTWDSQQKVVVL